MRETKILIKPVLVSIIVPTYQREKLLCQTINSLLSLEYPNYEIIVMDQTLEHTEETEFFFQSIEQKIRHIRCNQPSLVLALNAGLKLAKGEICLFVDDDITIPHADFIQQHLKNYDDQYIMGVAGKVLDANEPSERSFDPRSQDFTWGFFYTRWDHNEYIDSNMAAGANMSFRRNALMKAGGFDEFYAECPARFEQDLCLRVKENGGRVVFDPRAVVHHYYNSPGGCENRNLSDKYSHDIHSHEWYQYFFQSNCYFSLVHMPKKSLLSLFWFIYRTYALNLPYFRNGIVFFLLRQKAFFCGFFRGFSFYLRRKNMIKCRLEK